MNDKQFETIRREIDKGLAEMQAKRLPAGFALKELLKLTAILSLPVVGRRELVAGLQIMARQLEDGWPHSKVDRLDLESADPEGQA